MLNKRKAPAMNESTEHTSGYAEVLRKIEEVAAEVAALKADLADLHRQMPEHPLPGSPAHREQVAEAKRARDEFDARMQQHWRDSDALAREQDAQRRAEQEAKWESGPPVHPAEFTRGVVKIGRGPDDPTLGRPGF